MEHLKVKPNLNPRNYVQVMTAHCSACGRQIVEAEYKTLGEYNRKKSKWKQAILSCPYCKVIYKEISSERKTIAWKKERSDYIADCENGRFIVFKWDHSWRWSFRYYNEETPRAENTGVCFAVESAKRVCEKHKEWR